MTPPSAINLRRIDSRDHTVADVRGSHETILHEPLVAGVADVLREAIDRVIERRDA